MSLSDAAPPFDLLALESSPALVAAVPDWQHAAAQLTQVPHKGFGLVSGAALPLGTLILLEHAAAIADDEVELAQRLHACAKFDHVESLWCGGGAFDCAGVVRFNAFSVEGDGVTTANVNGADRVAVRSRVGLWCRAARFNHSCKPNAHWNVLGDLMIVRLSRDVVAGEELTISYHPAVDTFTRTTQKLSQFGFQCDCARCEQFRLHPEFAEAEAALAARFDRLTLQFQLRQPTPDPTKSLALAEFLEHCDEQLPAEAITTVRFAPLTCLAMLENNSGHFDLSVACNHRAQRLARTFLGAGARIEVEVAMNLTLSLLLLRHVTEATQVLEEARDSFCRRHGVTRAYFRAAFARYIDKVRALEARAGVAFAASLVNRLVDES